LAAALGEAVLTIREVDPHLIPNGGIRVGYALPGATTQNEVCTSDNATTIRFGADLDVARVILTVIRHDACLRSAAALRCTPDILHCIIDDLALDACAYPPAPPGSGSMDWGVESCCRDDVPDVIYGPKTAKNDPVLWIIAETPADVARNILMLSGCISYTSL
jgi:thiamine-phosphate diphosphorylase